ncbi:aldose 1-epimerase family protein [Acidisoma cellulosilytica]|uniref:Aldose 1-epimerase family protein n=1 Tax=Acidisoma cellulosilyticum TaxID=2802395 RepID=A0A963Z294_9PROT|nr:aldose 1-epimerase family protein [Acidisoma cellulosilyticum]MCB8881186.1 aldose 1-epimerase family protein [Acidisoma cellulosilyticum]
MVTLFGQRLDRRDLAARCGSLSQFAGVRLLSFADGAERGVRLLEFRTGTGLRFTVMIDRGFDIGDCEHRGRAIGWHSPVGFPHPHLASPEGEDGLGWLRAASGLLVTCGLDQILSAEETSADHFDYPGRRKVRTTLHGRVSMLPGRLTGYGESWDGDDCVLWCEGVVQQVALFGENLHLIRRIEARMGSDEILIQDRVVNQGFSPTPHMYLYHINLGYPLLDDGARYVAPIGETLWAAHAGAEYERQGIGYRTMGAPSAGFREQVWQHAMQADAEGLVRVALLNDRLGLGFEVETREREFPCHFEWQNLRSGSYALGIEPATNHVLGRNFAEERGELIWLGEGEARQYRTVLRVLDGATALKACEDRIRTTAIAPAQDYPRPTGRFAPLTRP